MTVRFDPSRLHAGRVTLSVYPGHGILFENLPTDGENGGSPLLNDGGVNGDEVRWQLKTVTGLAVDEFNEDGSVITTGVGNFTYTTFIGGVAVVPDFTYTAQSAGGSIDAGGVSSFTAQSTGGALLSALSGGSSDFSISSSGGAVIESAPEPGVYDAGGDSQFALLSSGGASVVVNCGGASSFIITSAGGATSGGDGVIIGVITMPVGTIRYRITA